ncbi:MAG: YihY/virulence factor BrkB family protein [Candidatus Dormiibacterota bacterium]
MGTLWRRWRRTLPLRTVARYLARSGPNQATLVAWNLLFSVFPITLLAVTVAGQIFQDPAAGREVAKAVASILPSGNGKAVLAALDSFHRDSGWLAIVGVVGLVWSGTSLFSAMDTAFAGLAEGHTRGFLAQKLTAAGMIVIFTVLAVPVVLSSSLLAALESVAGMPTFLHAGAVAVAAQVTAAVVVGWLLFTAIYALVPAQRRPLRAVAKGSLAAGLLFEGLSLLFPVYFHLAHGFSSYGETFALFFLILTYVFLLAQVTVLGYCVVLESGPTPAGPTGTGPAAVVAPHLESSAPASPPALPPDATG